MRKRIVESMPKNRETYSDYIARGGIVQQIPMQTSEDVIDSLKEKYREEMKLALNERRKKQNTQCYIQNHDK